MFESIKTFFLVTEKESEQFAKQFANFIIPGTILFLKGTLGVGKTTFVRGFLRGLQFMDKVKSPTFTLVEEYDFSWGVVYHFDLYRLSHAEELDFIGIREYFREDSIVFIEWPERGEGNLPLPDIELSFQILAQGRKVWVKACSEKGQAILGELK